MPDPLRRWVERRIAGHGGPSSDLYFVNACGDWLASGAVRRVSSTVFASETAVLVLRHGAGADLTAHRDKRLIWFCDDDIFAGVKEPGPRWRTRAKLMLAEHWFLRRWRQKIGAVVVSSPQLLDMARRAAPNAETAVLAPYWKAAQPDLSHFENPEWIDIACLGGRTHHGDLSLVWGALARALEVPNTRVWLAANHLVPEPLNSHPRLRRITETAWPEYRDTMAARRFHIALYPLKDTALNRARSVNKLIEHGLASAAAFYSESWPETAQAVAVGAGVALPGTPEAWENALLPLIEDLARAKSMAAAGQTLARTLNDPAPQRALWGGWMGI